MRIVILSDNQVLTTDDIVKSEINLISYESFTPIKEMSHSDNLIVLNPGTLEAMEENIIRWYMDKYNGNRSANCKSLNISRTTLRKKISDMDQK